MIQTCHLKKIKAATRNEQFFVFSSPAVDPFRTLNITNGISIDTDYKFIYRKKQSCDLVQILKGLEPFHDYIEGISIESTWLVLAGGWTDNYSATQKSGLSSLE